MIKTEKGETRISGDIFEVTTDLVMVVDAIKQHLIEGAKEALGEEFEEIGGEDAAREILIQHIALGLLSEEQQKKYIDDNDDTYTDIDALTEEIDSAMDRLLN